jgi:DNA-binding response OmpR family regulator
LSCGKVLVVEDDVDTLLLVKECLESSNFEVDSTQTGQGALDLIRAAEPDVLVLDLNLPDIDGLTVCRELRKSHQTPVLFLSSQDSDIDKIVGLEVGADDYLGKPFNPRELVARVRALYRRRNNFGQSQENPGLLVRGNLEIDKGAHSVKVDGEALHLTPTEFSLLYELALHPSQVLTRPVLLERIWGPDYFGDERLVDVHVRHLRKKLKARNCGEHVASVRGVGYKWAEL